MGWRDGGMYEDWLGIGKGRMRLGKLPNQSQLESRGKIRRNVCLKEL